MGMGAMARKAAREAAAKTVAAEVEQILLNDKKCELCGAPATENWDSHGAKGVLCTGCSNQLRSLRCPECDGEYTPGGRCPAEVGF